MDEYVRWTCSDQLDPYNPNAELKDVPPQLYNLDAVGYESLMLGLFSIYQGQYEKSKGLNKRTEVLLGFSRDGFHWHRPERQSLCRRERDGWRLELGKRAVRRRRVPRRRRSTVFLCLRAGEEGGK